MCGITRREMRWGVRARSVTGTTKHTLNRDRVVDRSLDADRDVRVHLGAHAPSHEEYEREFARLRLRPRPPRSAPFHTLFGDAIPQWVVVDRHGKAVIDSAEVGPARALAQLRELL